MDPLDAAQLSNYVDWSTQVVEEAPAWFNLKTPFLTALDSFSEDGEVSLIGKRFYFDKEEPGGHTLPTKSSPDFNRAKQGQSDSMYARAMMYVLPTAIEYRFMQDIMRNKPGQRMKMERYLKGITEVGAQQQEFFALGDGRGALAFSSSNLVVGTGLTMNCSTAAAADPGHTKGAVRLRKNQFYQAFNETTGNARGTLKVTTQGKTSCVVTVISGTVSSGDPICHVNGYNKAPRGLPQVLNNNPRILQGRDTSVDDVMNCPTLDKANTRLTIPDRDTAKTILVTYNVDNGSRENLVWVTTPGLMSDLRQQQYGFGRKEIGAAAEDSPKSYKDADGSTIIEAANSDEDLHYGFKRDQLKKLTEIEWGPLDDSGGPWRMLPGANETGSLLSARSWGCAWTIAIKSARSGILIKRCTPGAVTQSVTGV